ncbi:hypothetical protein [Flavobacterium hungaricum]|uniref:Methyltransferase domain-containing protein n=1 Tax=Flavobacterium hungaricum TaxID=2082725 RepID=A0ABR9TQZ4_9FLAO|nr:hypothetical protein [Flavobacterium hungaricum]MBE8727796.1 hypothetical protein [Flavobacterium hungaricum]
MKHSTKTRIFKVLSILPNTIGYNLYHFLQNSTSKLTIDKKINAAYGTYKTVVRILKENGKSLDGIRIGELGSGWVPVFPYQLILEGGVKHVDTYDINEHYNLKQIKELNEYYKQRDAFELQSESKYPLLKGVSYYPKTNICNGNLQDIDLVLSRFVLEHVPPNDIREIHNFLFSSLKSGSYILHLISPSDHRAYSDSSLSLQDFLKYSQEEWDKIQTKFDYHNRLRLPQYLDLFRDQFEIVHFEHDKINTESKSYKKFKELNIHSDFKKYNDQELMAGSINILLKKK